MMTLPKIQMYYVDHLIAEGGMARVYWGIDRRSGFPVAIKELKVEMMHRSSLDIIRIFKEEGLCYSLMQHPGITRLVDFIENDGHYFIIMEFVEGQTLSQYLYNIGLLPQEQAIQIMCQLLDIVEYMHQNDRMHLDIKCNNAMIQPDGMVKLLDMGISAKLSDTGNRTHFGTLSYMPPEQLDGERLGQYTDVYALGVVLFEMLTGELPFSGDRDKVKREIRFGATPQMRSIYPMINQQLQSIVERALAKAGADRYQSCAEFKGALMRVKTN